MSVHISQDQRKDFGSQVIAKCAKSLEFSEIHCNCKHEISGSGGIFLRSYGVIYCNECSGLQEIRKPIK